MLSRRWGGPVLVAYYIVVSGAILEALLLAPLLQPHLIRLLPASAATVVRANYLGYWRDLYVYLPGHAEYDPELTYTLSAGTHTYSSPEFSNTYRVNALGTRDDDLALNDPEVIVLGDSFAMGWGVEQEQAFPQRMRYEFGHRVLNAGVPSYGTVRELQLLDRLPRRALRFLVIQYSRNDFGENRTFFEHDNKLPIMSAARFAAEALTWRESIHYYPGRLTLVTVRRSLLALQDADWASGADPGARDLAGEARYFVNALLHAGDADLRDVRVVIVALDAYGARTTEFVRAVRRLVYAPQIRDRFRCVHVLDVSDAVGKAHYMLDDHLNPEGHEHIARAVTTVIDQHVSSLRPTPGGTTLGSARQRASGVVARRERSASLILRRTSAGPSAPSMRAALEQRGHLVRLGPRYDTIYVSQGRTVLSLAQDGFVHDGEHGLSVHQPRLLSRYRYLVSGEQPHPAGLSNVEEHSWLGYYIHDPPGLNSQERDRGSGHVQTVTQQTLELRLSRYVGEGLHEHVDLVNFSQHRTAFQRMLQADADFADQAERTSERQLLWWLGRKDEARQLCREAGELKKRFNDAFWLEHEGFVAMGLDSDKRPIRSIGSNAGHCVATAIVDKSLVRRTASG